MTHIDKQGLSFNYKERYFTVYWEFLIRKISEQLAFMFELTLNYFMYYSFSFFLSFLFLLIYLNFHGFELV